MAKKQDFNQTLKDCRGCPGTWRGQVTNVSCMTNRQLGEDTDHRRQMRAREAASTYARKELTSQELIKSLFCRIVVGAVWRTKPGIQTSHSFPLYWKNESF